MLDIHCNYLKARKACKKLSLLERFQTAFTQIYKALSGSYDKRIQELERKVAKAEAERCKCTVPKSTTRWRCILRYLTQEARVLEQRIELLTLNGKGTDADTQALRGKVTLYQELLQMADAKKFDRD